MILARISRGAMVCDDVFRTHLVDGIPVLVKHKDPSSMAINLLSLSPTIPR